MSFLSEARVQYLWVFFSRSPMTPEPETRYLETFKGDTQNHRKNQRKTPKWRVYRWLMMVSDGWQWVSIVMGVPHSWMVYFMENPIRMDDDWG